MARQLTVISGSGSAREHKVLQPDDQLKHFKNVTGAVLQDAQDTWADLWKELQGEVVDGVVLLTNGRQALQPKSGWPQFLEKMWLLKHQLDYARRFCEGKV